MVDVVGTLFELDQFKEVTVPTVSVLLVKVATNDTVAQCPRDYPACTTCICPVVESIQRYR